MGLKPIGLQIGILWQPSRLDGAPAAGRRVTRDLCRARLFFILLPVLAEMTGTHMR